MLSLVAGAGAMGALAFLLDRIGWGQVAKILGRIGVKGSLALLAVGLAEQILDAMAASVALPNPRKVNLLRMWAYSGIGTIVNIFIPWEAGEAAKAGLLRRHMDARDAIAGTIIWNYLFKLSRPATTLIAAIVGWLGVSVVPQSFSKMVVIASIAGFAPYLIFKLLLRFGFGEISVGLLTWLRIIRRNPNTWMAGARDVDRHVQTFAKQRPFAYAQVVLLQMAARVTAWASFSVALTAIGADYELATVAMIYAAYSMANYVMMVIPARIGVGETVGFFVFQAMGLDPTVGTLVILVLRIKAIVSSAIAAGFGPWLGGPTDKATTNPLP